MPGDQADLFANFDRGSLRQAQHAVLVGGLQELDARQVGDERHAGIHGQGFQSRIHHRAFGRGMAHHRRPHVQALLEYLDRLAVFVQVAVVVRVHEHIRPGLDFVVDAAARLEGIGAGAGASDDVGPQARFVQHLDRRAHLLHGFGDGGLAVCGRPHVLRCPLIGVQAGETQVFGGGDAHRQIQDRLPGFDAATVGTYVHFDQHVQFHAGIAGRRVEVADVAGVVNANADAGAFRERGEPGHLGNADDFVADHYVHDAAGDHGFRLGNFLATHAHRPVRHLPQGDLRALVRFGVRSHPHLESRQRLVHAVEIAFEGVEIQQERGRVHFGKRLARPGGRSKVGRHRYGSFLWMSNQDPDCVTGRSCSPCA